jgi:hypothetical protein
MILCPLLPGMVDVKSKLTRNITQSCFVTMLPN